MMLNSKQLMSSKNYSCKSLKRKRKSNKKYLKMKSKRKNRNLGSFKDGCLDLEVTHRMKNRKIKTRVIFKSVKGRKVVEEIKKQIKKIGMQIKKKNLRWFKRQHKNRCVKKNREKNKKQKWKCKKKFKLNKPSLKMKKQTNKLKGLIQLILKQMLIWKATQRLLCSLWIIQSHWL